jgi:hypothetical protein
MDEEINKLNPTILLYELQRKERELVEIKRKGINDQLFMQKLMAFERENKEIKEELKLTKEILKKMYEIDEENIKKILEKLEIEEQETMKNYFEKIKMEKIEVTEAPKEIEENLNNSPEKTIMINKMKELEKKVLNSFDSSRPLPMPKKIKKKNYIRIKINYEDGIKVKIYQEEKELITSYEKNITTNFIHLPSEIFEKTTNIKKKLKEIEKEDKKLLIVFLPCLIYKYTELLLNELVTNYEEFIKYNIVKPNF